MDILSNLNLNSNQVQNMVLHPSGTAPTAKTGAIYFDTTSDVHAVKVYGTVGGSSGWRTLLDGRNWSVTLAMLNCVLKDSDTSYLNSFAAEENTLIPTTGAVYGFFKEAIRRNDAMVYMGTFTGQSSSTSTVSASSFKYSAAYGGGNLTNFNGLSKGATFKVVAPATNPPATMYFGNVEVEAGDVILVGEDFADTSAGTTANVAKFDIIQMNLTNYVTTFGGATGAISLPAAQADTDSNVGVNLSMSGNTLMATLMCDKPVVTWAGGTSDGPTLTVKAMGKTSAAKAIPAAAVDASGVVTTVPQTFAGNKTFAGVVKTNDSFVISSPLTGVTTDSSSELAIRKQAYTINGNSIEAWQIRPLGDQNLRPLHIGGGSVIGLFYTGKKNYSGTTLENAWGIGTLDPQYKLHVNGTFGAGASTFSGNVTIGSSSRILFAHSSSNIDLPYLEIVNVGTAASPEYAIHTNVGFYSDSFVNAGGLGLNGSGSGGTGMANVWKYSDLSGANEFDQESEEDTFNAYAIKQMWLEAYGALNNTITSLTISGSGDVITNITKSGRTITATKGNVTHLALGSIGGAASSVNSMIESAGLEVIVLSGCSDAPSTNGSMLQWSRAVGKTDGTVNTAAQFFTGTSSNRLYFRNSWATYHNPTGSEWNPWLEVVTAGEGGRLNSLMSASLIHSCTVKRSSPVGGTWSATSGTNAYKVFTTSYIFSTADLVSALYDSDGNQVMTDVTVVAYSGSDTTLAGKYAVRLTFAQAVGTSTTYKLVIYGM